jgi:hypothetical protein
LEEVNIMGGTAAVIGLVISVIGAGASAYSAHQAGEARDDEADRMERMAKRDAEIHREQSEKLTAKQRALYAASGVKVGAGSPLAVIAASQVESEEERQEILRGYGFRIDALRTDASRTRTSGYLTGVGTLLGGVSNYAASPYAKNPFATGTP